MDKNCILFNSLSFSYDGKKEVLKNISFGIESGQSVGIIGANGAGKSTLLKIVMGLLPNYEGKVFVDGNPVIKENYSDIRKNVGYVFQNSENQLFSMTVYDDVAFAPLNYGYSKEEVENTVEETIEKLNIKYLKNRYIHKLSGGEKKLVAIASVLSVLPKILVLDEPTVALDPKNRRNFINILNSLEYTKIMAAHDLDMIYDTCQRVILLSDGRVVADGETKKLLKNREILEKCGLELPLRFT